MISLDCDFEKFISEIRDRDYYDVIYLAEKEATQAWRRSYKNHLRTCDSEASRTYQEKLIGLIDYMRHGLKPRILTDHELRLCDEVRIKYPQARRSAARVGYPTVT